MSPAETLRARAKECDAAAEAALARGDAIALAVATHQAHTLRLAADELERLAGGMPLRSRQPESIVNSPMFTDEHRRNMSLAKAKTNDELLAAAQAHGIPSLAALARAVGISKSLLTMARSKKDPSAMPAWAAEKIAALTGYPAARWARLS